MALNSSAGALYPSRSGCVAAEGNTTYFDPSTCAASANGPMASFKLNKPVWGDGADKPLSSRMVFTSVAVSPKNPLPLNPSEGVTASQNFLRSEERRVGK